MTAFDAAGREACTVRPSRTSTPLQALALMNDVTFVEASRTLAQRILHEGKNTDPASRLQLAFRLVLTRSPKPHEQKILLEDLKTHLSRFRSNPTAAQSFLTSGESTRDTSLDPTELAAYTAVAGLLLNLDEAIVKE
jgi:hypothetical protein